ncbi:hypothetical protein POM88_026519 [Heracleum sosnowskyi]|uniref:Heat shock protein 70 n=1 Tax=Heracleum sosnowskyi TaxID=360622 RepID=A0AAD8I712_9APIA|nr:hypothetical protein POM88_026519 [Heracleum sosnowskyi]
MSRDDDVAVGIDLGTTYSCVGVWQHNRVEIIANDLGNRTTPSCVAFTETQRFIGEAATNQAALNPVNTIFDVKRLIGRRFTDSTVQSDLKLWPFKTKMIGAKWLNNGEDDVSGKDEEGDSSVSDEKFAPTNQELRRVGKKYGDMIAQNLAGGELSGNSKIQYATVGGNIFKNNKGVTVPENKKRRTEVSFENPMGLNTEFCLDSEGEDNISMDRDASDVPKNVFAAGTGERARQSSRVY